MSIAKRKTQNYKTKENHLKRSLIHATSLNQSEEMKKTNEELELFQTYRQQGAQVRSRQPPMLSIDEPHPNAYIKEAANQSEQITTLNNTGLTIIISPYIVLSMDL